MERFAEELRWKGLENCAGHWGASAALRHCLRCTLRARAAVIWAAVLLPMSWPPVCSPLAPGTAPFCFPTGAGFAHPCWRSSAGPPLLRPLRVPFCCLPCEGALLLRVRVAQQDIRLPQQLSLLKDNHNSSRASAPFSVNKIYQS